MQCTVYNISEHIVLTTYDLGLNSKIIQSIIQKYFYLPCLVMKITPNLSSCKRDHSISSQIPIIINYYYCIFF